MAADRSGKSLLTFIEKLGALFSKNEAIPSLISGDFPILSIAIESKICASSGWVAASIFHIIRLARETDTAEVLEL